MAKSKDTQPAPIDPEAHYRVAVATRFDFEGIEFGPLALTEVVGELLARLMAGDRADQVTAYAPA